jgi:vacuolar-type H+-ATPase subunit D/Vma8
VDGMRDRKVTYSFVDTYHGLCKDKKDIILSEIQACESLMNDISNEVDKSVIVTELSELKMTLDLLP